MDTNIILLIVYLLQSSSSSDNDQVHIIKDYFKSMEIKPDYTKEKLKLVKNLLPLVPEEYGNPVQKSVLLSEKIIRILEITEVMNQPTDKLEYTPIPVANNQERINKIISIVQKDFSKPKVKNLGIIMEIITNMDKYKKMFSVVSSLTSSTENNKDSKNMFKLMETFMGEGDQKSMDSFKDIAKMMELMKVLDSPIKEKTIEA